jgi:uncharacterized membrane protein
MPASLRLCRNCGYTFTKMKFAKLASHLRLSAERLRPESVFLALACSFGLAVLFANAPFQAPDENDHYFRVFQLSEGTLIGEKKGHDAGGELPQAVIDVTDTGGIMFHSEKKMNRALFARLLRPAFLDWKGAPRVFHGFPHTVVYAPAGYLPQTLAVLFGRFIRIGPLGLMYLARLGGFAASVALGYAAMRILPIFRWTILVILMCPMSLYLLGSIAPVGILIASALLLMALLVRIAMRPVDRPTGCRDVAVPLLLAAVLAAAKPVYLPLAGVSLFFVLPKLGSLRAKLLIVGATVAFCVLPTLYWARVAIALFVAAKGGTPIDPSAQAHYILGAPLEFLELVGHTIHVQYLYNFRWMVGTLGWGDTPMPGWFYPTFGLGLLGCLILESGGSAGFGWRLRFVMIVAAASSILLIYAAQYASWNPPGSQLPIEGVEGRYFLPLAPLVILSFPAGFGRPHRLIVRSLATILSVLCGAICILAVISRYYLGPSEPFSANGTARLTKFSTRVLVGNGANILVTGFVVSGEGLEKLLVRASGPALGKSGVSGFLAETSVRVLDANGAVLASNTGWGMNSDSAQISAASASLGIPELPPNSEDSALIVSVPEGTYSVQVSGAKGATGLVLQEIYEISRGGTRLTNFSSRGFVGKDRNMMIVGVTMSGTGSETLLARADGPSLAQFGVDGMLSQPVIEMGPLPSGDIANTGWGSSSARARIETAASVVGAFPFASNSADSALVATVPAGAYTLTIHGVGGETGVAVAEIYELP